MDLTEPIQILSGLFALATGLALYLTKGRSWLRAWHERRLRRSVVFSEVKEFMAASERTHRRLTDSIDRVHKSVLRLTLFGQTTSRRVHEQQLEAGRQYLALGGNGPAEAHYQILYDDYANRCKTNNWHYSKEQQW